MTVGNVAVLVGWLMLSCAFILGLCVLGWLLTYCVLYAVDRAEARSRRHAAFTRGYEEDRHGRQE